MRIGIDMLGDQSAGRARGVGRYTRGLVSRLIAEAGHEFVLYYYRGLPSVENGLRAARRSTDDVAPSLGGTARCPFPTEVRELATGAGESLHLSIEQLARTNPDGLDVLLLTCPLENFQGYVPPFPPRRCLKLAAIVYDLIPLIYPEHYLHHPAIARAYHRALCALRQYDLLLTISEAGRRDVVDRLGISPDRVVNISAGSDAGRFAPSLNNAEQDADAACLGALGIREPFLFCLTALDFRKNLTGFLAAADRLPVELQNGHQIVISCATSSPEDVGKARLLISRCAVAQRVVLVEAIDDAALRTLYRRAAAFVFPSRYEGFGLPLLEAIQCGAVVVAGDNSSQREVIGDAGLVADVDRPADLAACITKVLTDQPLAEQLRARARRQAWRFSWEATAQRCCAALEASLAAPRATGRLRVWTARAQWAVTERMTRWSSLGPQKSLRSRSERQLHSNVATE